MKLRDEYVQHSVRELNAEILTLHLGDLTLSDELIDQLYIRLRQANALVIKRGYTRERRDRRASFLNDIRAYLFYRGVESRSLDPFADLVAVFDFCDIGYAQIERDLPLRNSLLKRSITTRFAALLEAAAEEFRHIEKAGMEGFLANPIADHRVAMVQKQGQPQAFADSALQSVIEGLTSALKREGFTEALWDDEGHLVIPRLAQTGQRLRDKARGVLAGALIWANWEIIEQRIRYHGGRFEDIPQAARPTVHSDATALRYVPTATEVAIMTLLAAAEERLASRVFQAAMTLARLTRGQRSFARIGEKPSPPPDAAISEGEVLAAEVLEDVLAIKLRDDVRRYGGLRVAEWLRGYATLGVLAREQNTLRSATMTLAALAESLIGAGLNPVCVEPFLQVATFGRRSADLWDAPLLKVRPISGDVPDYQLVWPAARSANLALIVVSAISTIGESQVDKGPAFEVAVSDVITEAGFNPKRLYFRRDGAEYEADVVFTFEDAIVMIECKNRGVPTADPIDQYRFLADMADHRRKIDRIRDALARYPEVLDGEFGAGSSERRILPIVTYSLPFAAPTAKSGISYIDYVALRRFFLDPQISAVQFDSRVNDDITLEVPLCSLWSGERPSIGDFERYLEEPPQLRVALRHLERAERLFFSHDDFFVFGPSIQRVAATRASIVQALADDPASAMQRIDQAAELLRGWREEQ